MSDWREIDPADPETWPPARPGRYVLMAGGVPLLRGFIEITTDAASKRIACDFGYTHWRPEVPGDRPPTPGGLF